MTSTERVPRNEGFYESDDSLVVIEDQIPSQLETSWKIMIVDDDRDVYNVTKLALKNFTFLGRGLTFVSAYSGEEAKQLMVSHPDTVIILLDAIMETEWVGFEVVKYVRETLNNKLVRIILRTGQPGQVPEKDVILNYDIDRYLTKGGNLTDEKLFGTLYAALRDYDNLQQLQQAKSKLADYSHNLELKVEQRTLELQLKNSHLTQALNKLKIAQKQIIAQEKLAYLGTLTAGVAHEIRNPLNFVNNLAGMTGDLAQDLAEELETPTPSLEAVRQILSDIVETAAEIKTYGARADSIIQNMLAHAHHKGSLTQELRDLNQLLDEAVKLAYHSARSRYKGFNTAILTDFDASVGKISLYPVDISRALINILDNACYALYKKRSRRGADYSPKLEVRTTRLDGQVEIVIRDNGCGMPAHLIEKIFNPFFTTKPAGQGTGLGLALTNEIIVGKHQGFIHVDSKDGEFTEFQIQLPIG